MGWVGLLLIKCVWRGTVICSEDPRYLLSSGVKWILLPSDILQLFISKNTCRMLVIIYMKEFIENHEKEQSDKFQFSFSVHRFVGCVCYFFFLNLPLILLYWWCYLHSVEGRWSNSSQQWTAFYNCVFVNFCTEACLKKNEDFLTFFRLYAFFYNSCDSSAINYREK